MQQAFEQTMDGVKNKVLYICGKCHMCFEDYKILIQHLFWKHNAEGLKCTQCSLKRWPYAAHFCNVLPFDESILSDNDEQVYCCCGKEDNTLPMIACDYPLCIHQWYHFQCVGIVSAPDGDWYCRWCLERRKVEEGKTQSKSKIFKKLKR